MHKFIHILREAGHFCPTWYTYKGKHMRADAFETWCGYHDEDEGYCEPYFSKDDLPEDGKADWYGVYMHLPEGDIEHLEDYNTAVEAQEAGELLAAVYGLHYYDYIVEA